MSRVLKNTNFIFILLAGLVIFLHTAIPHHHHLDSYSNHDNTNKTETKGESSTEANRHCHALNNIIFTKAISISIEKNNSFNSLLFVNSAFNLIKLYSNRVLFTTYLYKDIVILKQYLSSDLSFRGPPTLV